MIISIASGKGGTGKTLVATSLALSLKDREKVRLLDCDVEEPDDHIFLKHVINRSEPVNIKVPEINKERCNYCRRCAEICAYNAIAVFPDYAMVFPHLCHGCGACSYLCPQKAITEVAKDIGTVEYGNAGNLEFVQGKLTVGEAMPTSVIRKVKESIDFKGTVIIDISPGTSCPVVESLKGSDFCLLVTEPTPFGLNDLKLAVETVRDMKISHGVLINRANIGDSRIEHYCHKEKIPVLLKIPFDIKIAQNYSKGITLAEGMPEWREKFLTLYFKITEMINERSRCLKR